MSSDFSEFLQSDKFSPHRRVTSREAAEFLGYRSLTTLNERLENDADFPRPISVEKKRRYWRFGDLMLYVQRKSLQIPAEYKKSPEKRRGMNDLV